MKRTSYEIDDIVQT